ncbi:hypothetical protein L596_008705 [Steinernema carpocapsae]|uniref:Uncharacterized protein n=2 Tax=Steinernema carpocapsae TaxID=34508 RepID=A0A4V6A6D2_STECR|nr:hypothetical protein L596_008705 [Steinernema carpocapsae]
MLPRRSPALGLLALFVVGSLAQFSERTPCFCKGPQGEAVDDCPCIGQNIDDFNNRRVFPILQRLLQKDFFRFYKVNMEKTCPFWQDTRQCGSTLCGIQHCDDIVPAAIKDRTVISVVRLNRESNTEILLLNRTVENSIRRMQVRPAPPASSKEEAKEGGELCPEAVSNQFDPLDSSLSEESRAQLQQMDEEDNMNKFCDYDDEDSEDSHYMDLTKNPERYTGYAGNSAWKVWKSIYQENCFKPDPKFDKNFLMHPNTVGLCLEKRVFFRLMSGMHSAITISIASNCYKPAPESQFNKLMGNKIVNKKEEEKGTWFRNNEMFKKSFGTVLSAEGPERLKNVYFVYLMELRALLKAAPYLQNELFFTGNEQEDKETRQLIEELMEVIRSHPAHFDETEMFTTPTVSNRSQASGPVAAGRILENELRDSAISGQESTYGSGRASNRTHANFGKNSANTS